MTRTLAAPLCAAFQTGSVFWSSYVLLSLHVWMIVHRLRTSQQPDVKFFRQRFYMQVRACGWVRVRGRMHRCGWARMRMDVRMSVVACGVD